MLASSAGSCRRPWDLRHLSAPSGRISINDRQLFAMYVIPVETLLQLKLIKSFDELMDEELLVEFDESKGHAMFVSHQWAGTGHPDPHMEQFWVLQEALRNILSRETTVLANINIELYVGHSSSQTGKEVSSRPLFLWYDYSSCPQSCSKTEQRERAILSIPAYIQRCRFFAILCPAVVHAKDSTLLSKFTWETRGWCRLERFCNELSLREGPSQTIEIQGCKHQALAANFDWVKAPVGEGCFTQAEDREKVAPVLQSMATNKLLSSLSKGDFHNYRLMLNLQGVHFRNMPIKPAEGLIPGFSSDEQDPASFLLAEFMHQNGFLDIFSRSAEGWTPLCYAALNGNPLLMSALLQMHADPNDAITRPEPLCQFAEQTTALQMCCFFKHNEAVRLLLLCQANIHTADGYGANALHWAAVNNNAEGTEFANLLELSLLADDVIGITAKTELVQVFSVPVTVHVQAGSPTSLESKPAKQGGCTFLRPFALSPKTWQGIEILCAAGCKLDTPNMLGYSAFAMACAGGSIRAMKDPPC